MPPPSVALYLPRSGARFYSLAHGSWLMVVITPLAPTASPVGAELVGKPVRLALRAGYSLARRFLIVDLQQLGIIGARFTRARVSWLRRGLGQLRSVFLGLVRSWSGPVDDGPGGVAADSPAPVRPVGHGYSLGAIPFGSRSTWPPRPDRRPGVRCSVTASFSRSRGT